MFSITVITFLITQCSANRLTPPASRILPENQDTKSFRIPLEYFDDMRIELPKPDYRFTYVFKQINNDQAPTVEKREEEIEKYVSRPPTTPTTSTSPTTERPRQNINSIFDYFNKNEKARSFYQIPIIVMETHHKHHRHHKVQKPTTTTTLTPTTPTPTTPTQITTTSIPTTLTPTKPTMIPLPPAPKWQEINDDVLPLFPSYSWESRNYKLSFPEKMPSPPMTPEKEDLKEILENHTQLQLPAHAMTTDPQRHPSHQVHMQLTSSATPDEVQEHKKEGVFRKPNRPAASHRGPSLPHELRREAVTTENGEIKEDSYLQIAPHTNRGSYKFSWDDVNDMHTAIAVLSTTPASVPQRDGNSPPPVPKLSPWFDGYGK